MKVQPYLFFDGRCEEAIRFYQKALGVDQVSLLRRKDSPEPPVSGPLPPGCETKILHASFRLGETTVMLSDGHCQGSPNFQGFSLTLSLATAAEAERLFPLLADGGQVQMPLTATFYSPCFGMVADRFGVSWMLLVEPKKS